MRQGGIEKPRLAGEGRDGINEPVPVLPRTGREAAGRAPLAGEDAVRWKVAGSGPRHFFDVQLTEGQVGSR